MSLLDELEQAKAKSRRGPTCEAGLFLASLAPDEREELRAVLNDARYYSSTIALVLKARGHVVSVYSIQRHRRDACACSDG